MPMLDSKVRTYRTEIYDSVRYRLHVPFELEVRNLDQAPSGKGMNITLQYNTDEFGCRVNAPEIRVARKRCNILPNDKSY